MKYRRGGHANTGFTLIEMITTIVILGILSGVVATFFKPAVDSYVDVANRAELSEKADTAIRQLSRELQTALPNSVRSTTTGSTDCIEFLPVVAGGRYRVQPNSTGGGDILDFAIQDSAFDVLASEGLSAIVGSGQSFHVAIFNLGTPRANAYNGDVTAKIDTTRTSGSTAQAIRLNAGKQFPFSSPRNRFFVIPDHSVIYHCRNNGIYRSTPVIAATAPATCQHTNTETLVVDHVTACSFTYTPAVDQRNGLISISLQLSQNNETLSLYQEVLVSNVP